MVDHEVREAQRNQHEADLKLSNDLKDNVATFRRKLDRIDKRAGELTEPQCEYGMYPRTRKEWYSDNWRHYDAVSNELEEIADFVSELINSVENRMVALEFAISAEDKKPAEAE